MMCYYSFTYHMIPCIIGGRIVLNIIRGLATVLFTLQSYLNFLKVSFVYVCIMSRYFTVRNEITRHYRRFNAEGRELTVRLTTPPASSTAARNFTDSVEA